MANFEGSTTQDNQFANNPLMPAAAAAYPGTFSASSATVDIDTLTQTAGNDTLILTGTDKIQADDFFDGSDGTDTLIVQSTTDIRGATFQNYEGISFNGTSNAAIHTAGSQYGSALAYNLAVSGAASADTIVVHDASSFDATGWTFTNWNTASDALWVYGTGGNDTIFGSSQKDILIGGAGDDVYGVNSTSDIVVEHASEGTDEVRSTVTYTLGADIENLQLMESSAISGTGNVLDNVITGNSAINKLTGLGGNDTLNGGLGADTMIGGLGDDTYYVDNAKDIVTEVAGVGSGADTVYSTVSYRLGANVENLYLVGGGDNYATGNAVANNIFGNSGANRIDGGAGADVMYGGAGNDTYVVDNILDNANELAENGTDLVLSSVSFVLGTNVENLTLTGTKVANGTGNELNNHLIGNAVANILTGLDGDDTLDGGKGIDQLIGGLGNDTYFVDVAGDVVTESADEGIDTVNSNVTYVLGANLENLTLTGTGATSATGNAADNILIGNAAANTLTGNDGDDTLNGGKGIDHMNGGQGDDTYYVDVTGDVVTEAADQGTDTVYAASTFTLSANVENLVLTGTAISTGTGNALNNHLIGNGNANTLVGLDGDDILDGAAGGDTMRGGAGDDVYYVESLNDLVVENAAEGNDTVYSNINYTLTANTENLVLTGTETVNGIGNASANQITGNSVANTLSGLAGNDAIDGAGGNDLIKGGLGQDMLTGGDGDDTFEFDVLADSVVGSADLIMDFATGDRIDLSAIDANSTIGGNQTFVLDDDGVAAAGEVRVVNVDEGVFRLDVYTNGDTTVDMSITVYAASLSETDLVL
jgi:trimeric autotransporter adhesin